LENEVLVGEVFRPLHTANETDQQGLIKEKIQDLFTGREFRFAAFSMIGCRNQTFQAGDLVEFKIGTVFKTGEKRAVEVKPLRQRIKSKVNCVKGEEGFLDDKFGFINHETPENKQLFFHQSEVADGVRLKPNDEVEFDVIRNAKTNKLSAGNVKRISTTANTSVDKTTDRLSHRVRTISLNNPETKVAIIREPYTSDGSRGFQFQRTTTEPCKKPSDYEDDEDDLFSNNLDDEICGEDGSGDYNHRDDEKTCRLDEKIKSCGDS
jgi:cold shock CspA family protein